ncbi:MAG TPA: MFS transporter [Bacteroidales bacterium]|nr:MFS transporter [Bacteroidales bacterium]HRZ20511.1 MFS transporter [Bacteroidales bacterium]
MSNVTRVFRKLPSTYWWANVMELFERWAWYGMFMVLALYLTGSRETGALGFSQTQKGLLMGTVVMTLYFLPVITGALADKFGFKKVLIVAYLILTTGYYLMGQFTSYTMMFIVFFYVGLGAGLFKPVIQATVAKTTDAETSSIGFGIFYMMVNIGAFIGPLFASDLRLASWKYVFLMSAAVILVNLLIVLFFYKEPAREKNTDRLGKALVHVLKNIGSALSDFRFVVFLLIIIGFWSMYNQLFYTLPVFIEQWVDTTVVYKAIASISPGLAQAFGTPMGTIAPERLTNMDAFYIIILQILVSSFVMRFRPLNAMMGGILVCSIGIGLWFITQNGLYLFISLLIFGLGEMASSPKISEYIGRIAPKDKVALYMGCSFIPLAGGNFIAGLLSGGVYTNMADKISLLRTEVAARGLSIPEISGSFTQNDYLSRASELMGMDQMALTDYLWNTYHPSRIWMVFSGIGLATVVALFLYDRLWLRKK